MSLQLTERAAEEIKTIIKQQNLDTADTYLRLGVKGGGCSGFTYSLDLSDTKNETDQEYEEHGIKIICDQKSHLYLNGTTVDFKEELMERGFVFDNPNASGTCGCGSSFST